MGSTGELCFAICVQATFAPEVLHGHCALAWCTTFLGVCAVAEEKARWKNLRDTFRRVLKERTRALKSGAAADDELDESTKWHSSVVIEGERALWDLHDRNHKSRAVTDAAWRHVATVMGSTGELCFAICVQATFAPEVLHGHCALAWCTTFLGVCAVAEEKARWKNLRDTFRRVLKERTRALKSGAAADDELDESTKWHSSVVIEGERALWDLHDRNYKSRAVTDAAWRHVATVMGSTGELCFAICVQATFAPEVLHGHCALAWCTTVLGVCAVAEEKARWKNLRDTFRRVLKERTRALKSGAPADDELDESTKWHSLVVIEGERALWDLHDRNYKSRAVTDVAWRHVATVMGSTGELCFAICVQATFAPEVPHGHCTLAWCTTFLGVCAVAEEKARWKNLRDTFRRVLKERTRALKSGAAADDELDESTKWHSSVVIEGERALWDLHDRNYKSRAVTDAAWRHVATVMGSTGELCFAICVQATFAPEVLHGHCALAWCTTILGVCAVAEEKARWKNLRDTFRRVLKERTRALKSGAPADDELDESTKWHSLVVIEGERALWDLHDRNYKSRAVTDVAWRHVATVMGSTGELCFAICVQATFAPEVLHGHCALAWCTTFLGVCAVAEEKARWKNLRDTFRRVLKERTRALKSGAAADDELDESTKWHSSVVIEGERALWDLHDRNYKSRAVTDAAWRHVATVMGSTGELCFAICVQATFAPEVLHGHCALAWCTTILGVCAVAEEKARWKNLRDTFRRVLKERTRALKSGAPADDELDESTKWHSLVVIEGERALWDLHDRNYKSRAVTDAAWRHVATVMGSTGELCFAICVQATFAPEVPHGHCTLAWCTTFLGVCAVAEEKARWKNLRDTFRRVLKERTRALKSGAPADDELDESTKWHSLVVIEGERALWDLHDRNYKSRAVTDVAWRHVATVMGSTGELCFAICVQATFAPEVPHGHCTLAWCTTFLGVCAVAEEKARWKNLRDTFRRVLKERTRALKSGAPADDELDESTKWHSLVVIEGERALWDLHDRNYKSRAVTDAASRHVATVMGSTGELCFAICVQATFAPEVLHGHCALAWCTTFLGVCAVAEEKARWKNLRDTFRRVLKERTRALKNGAPADDELDESTKWHSLVVIEGERALLDLHDRNYKSRAVTDAAWRHVATVMGSTGELCFAICVQATFAPEVLHGHCALAWCTTFLGVCAVAEEKARWKNLRDTFRRVLKERTRALKNGAPADDELDESTKWHSLVVIEGERALWDLHDRNYKSRAVTDAASRHVATVMGSTGELCFAICVQATFAPEVLHGHCALAWCTTFLGVCAVAEEKARWKNLRDTFRRVLKERTRALKNGAPADDELDESTKWHSLVVIEGERALLGSTRPKL
ncbi:hypothetical protein MRX96_033901 [Rhipicephalus microplus]